MGLERVLGLPVLRILRDTTATARAVAFAIGVVAGAVGLAYVGIRKSALSPDAATVLVASLAAIILGGLASWFYVAGIYDPSYYKIVDLDGHVLIEPAGDHHRYTYTRKQTVRATRGSLRLIEIRSHWTGRCSREKTSITSVIRDHRLLDGGYPEEDGRVHRWIYPGRSLDRGEEIEVGVRVVMEDDIEPMIPYYREGGGRYRVRQLKVTVRFPIGHEPQRVFGSIWHTNRKAQQGNHIGKLDYERRPDHDAGVVDYIVVVQKPRLYHSYGVRWSW
jgi:hypothetical protein